MRTQVYFRNVASIQDVNPDGSNLFPNIGIAEGTTHQAQLDSALQTLINVPAIDSVILFAAAEAPEVPLETLRTLSLGRRIKIDTDPSKILLDPSWVQQDVERYLNTRMTQLSVEGGAALDMFGHPITETTHNPFMPTSGSYSLNGINFNGKDVKSQYGADIATLTSYYAAQVGDVAKATNARLIRSSLSYSPLYGSSVSDDGYINCHIDDEPSFDARLIHVSMGSGTVLFDARDFEIRPGMRNGIAVLHPHLIHDEIVCLTLPKGASALIREPSPTMLAEGRMPSIHSHGIGREDGQPEERLVERHDLELF